MTSPIDPSIMKRAREVAGQLSIHHSDEDRISRLALAFLDSERRGMERAAEICWAYADQQDKTVKANAVARAILAASPQPKEGE